MTVPSKLNTYQVVLHGYKETTHIVKGHFALVSSNGHLRIYKTDGVVENVVFASPHHSWRSVTMEEAND